MVTVALESEVQLRLNVDKLLAASCLMFILDKQIRNFTLQKCSVCLVLLGISE